jgi:hypothetical protein
MGKPERLRDKDMTGGTNAADDFEAMRAERLLPQGGIMPA